MWCDDSHIVTYSPQLRAHIYITCSNVETASCAEASQALSSLVVCDQS